jgi:hypothetical protein
MSSFSEKREIESLTRTWKIAEIVDFEELKEENKFSLPSLLINSTKMEDAQNLKSEPNISKKITQGPSVTKGLSLTIFKMEKNADKRSSKLSTKRKFLPSNASSKKLRLSEFLKKI